MIVGATFTVARAEGVFRKGDRWTIIGHDPRGNLVATCPGRLELVWRQHTLDVLHLVGILTPVEQTREQQLTKLRSASPMRGRVAQHDAGDLGLFPGCQ